MPLTKWNSISPLLQLVAGLVLAVSIIAILLGLVQGRAVRSWVITGSVSLVLALFSLYILDTPYDTGSGGGGDDLSAGEDGGSASGEGANTTADYGVNESGGGSPCDSVAPELQELAQEYSSVDSGNAPIYMPSYLPFSVANVRNWEEARTLYFLTVSDGGEVYLDYIQDSPFASSMPGVQSIEFEGGDDYHYLVEREDVGTGYYSVLFGKAQDSSPVRLSYRFTSNFTRLSPTEFMAMFSSLVGIYPSAGGGC